MFIHVLGTRDMVARPLSEFSSNIILSRYPVCSAHKHILEYVI